jgi:hypothetical protein
VSETTAKRAANSGSVSPATSAKPKRNESLLQGLCPQNDSFLLYHQTHPITSKEEDEMIKRKWFGMMMIAVLAIALVSAGCNKSDETEMNQKMDQKMEKKMDNGMDQQMNKGNMSEKGMKDHNMGDMPNQDKKMDDKMGDQKMMDQHSMDDHSMDGQKK